MVSLVADRQERMLTERELETQRTTARLIAREVATQGELRPDVVLVLDAAREGGRVYLVDEAGRVIAQDEASRPLVVGDRSAQPPVAALLGGQEAAGATIYRMTGRAWLAGYATVPGTGRGVVVELPLDLALVAAYSGRDLAFLLLLGTVLLAALAGASAANRLTLPLAVLSEAVTRLAAGDRSAPLPRTDTTELERLGSAFDALRASLAARTAERERAERALRESAAEARKLALVASRTDNAVLIVDLVSESPGSTRASPG
jgi:HAMP domain-containing protein